MFKQSIFENVDISVIVRKLREIVVCIIALFLNAHKYVYCISDYQYGSNVLYLYIQME